MVTAAQLQKEFKTLLGVTARSLHLRSGGRACLSSRSAERDSTGC